MAVVTVVIVFLVVVVMVVFVVVIVVIVVIVVLVVELVFLDMVVISPLSTREVITRVQNRCRPARRHHYLCSLPQSTRHHRPITAAIAFAVAAGAAAVAPWLIAEVPPGALEGESVIARGRGHVIPGVGAGDVARSQPRTHMTH